MSWICTICHMSPSKVSILTLKCQKCLLSTPSPPSHISMTSIQLEIVSSTCHCESRRFSLQVSKLKSRSELWGGPSGDSLSIWVIAPVLPPTYSWNSRLQKFDMLCVHSPLDSNVTITHVFLVSIINCKSWHIPFKYIRPIMKSDHVRLIYLSHDLCTMWPSCLPNHLLSYYSRICHDLNLVERDWVGIAMLCNTCLLYLSSHILS